MTKNKKKVLYITEGERSIQYRYRCKNIAEALVGSNKWGVDICLSKDVNNSYAMDGVNLVVIERQAAKNKDVLKFIKLARNRGVKVLFDLDDLVFDFRDLPLLMWSTNSKNIFYWVLYFTSILRVARRVDGFLCTNVFLAKKLKRSFGKPVKVIPNSLNREQMEVSEEWVKKLGKMDGKKKAVKSSDKFVIGYFSGSPTHTKDFHMIEGELMQFLRTHDDAVLRIVGDMELSREMRKWMEMGRVEILKKVDYLKLQELIAKTDVNIAPLVINDFTNCKSELKFFEAAVVETTTIASPIYTFRKTITDGVNGFLARPGEWYKKLEYLYQHPRENHRMAIVAKKYAVENYYGKNFLKCVEEAYDYFTK